MAEKDLLSNMSYTNKSFQDIYPELLDLVKKISYRWDPSESNESDPGVVLLKLCAIIADKCNYNIDKNILECFPASVTQDSNARELFAQLGYYMHWYQAATSTVQMYWKKEDEYVYSIPRFTMVSDEENNVIYTITSDVKLDGNGDLTDCPVIQGAILDFLINGESVITVNNLDSNNRIYFSSFNVAENGIFIKNSLYGYDDWRRVDNLAVEELGQPIYKFGITRDGNSCYLEFPEDAFNLFGDGLTIKYISTDGAEGNVSAHVISKFFNEPSATYGENNSESISLTSDNTVVYNKSGIRNGYDPESIEDAYKNYKKTIGTFNTLVTLRDYNNAIRTAKSNGINLVSNGFVCDRTNDIQCSYRIVTDVDDIQKEVLAVEDNPSTRRTSDAGIDSYEPYITAFDLKLYLLENIMSADDVNVKSGEQATKGAKFYNTTFTPLNNGEYKTSYVVDMVKHYLEDKKSLQHDFQQILSNKICMIKNRYPVKCKIIPQYKLTTVQADDVRDNIYKALYNGLNARKVEFGEEVSYDTIYDIIVNSDERIKSIMLDNIAYTTYAVYCDDNTGKYCEVDINSFDEFITGRYDESTGEFYEGNSDKVADYNPSAVYVDLTTGKCYKHSDGALSEDLRAEFQTEVYAKSVLSGTTQILEPDNAFNYRMFEKFVGKADNVSNITTNTNIRLASTGGTASYTLKDNESIKFYAPNLEEKTNYSTYVKIQYALAHDVEAKSDYELNDNEFITFYWKSSDEDAAPYEYYKYGKGTIICPDFTILAKYGYTNGTRYHSADSIECVSYGFEEGKHTCSAESSEYLSKINDNNYILTATKKISIKGKIEKSLKYPYYCYWILNNKTSTSSDTQVYKLFDAVTEADNPEDNITKQQYILQPGEYFIYTNAAKTGAEMFEAGTRITRTFPSGNASEMSCEIVDEEKYESMGIEALDNLFKRINSNETITLTEMQIISIPPNAEISISANGWALDTDQTVTEGQTAYGVELNGTAIDPNKANLNPYTSSRAYNLNYGEAYGWYDDTDSEGNDLYVDSIVVGDAYSKNIDLADIAAKYKMDPTDKAPDELGISAGEDFVQIYAHYAPEFEKNTYYTHEATLALEPKPLESAPADWTTNYSKYYYKRPYHAYNSKYASSVVWKNDADKDFPYYATKTPYSVIWKEDEEYLALGHRISEGGPDLIKLSGKPSDTTSSNTYYAKYGLDYWYKEHGSRATSTEIIANTKYVCEGDNNWWKNSNYKGNLSDRLPITTYHAYNPKFKFKGYGWVEDSSVPEFESTRYIPIAGTNCTPHNCLLVPSWVGKICINRNLNKVWEVISSHYTWLKLLNLPDGVALEDCLEYTKDPNDEELEMNLEVLNSYTYVRVPGDTPGEYFYYVKSDAAADGKRMWSISEKSIDDVFAHVEVVNDSDPTNYGYVELAAKPGVYAINKTYATSTQGAAEYKYFKSVELFDSKSWTQAIVYGDAISELSTANNSASSPAIEGVIPSLGKHIRHKYTSRVWLEDYTTADSTDGLTFISGANSTPVDNNIDPFTNTRVLNNSYSYHFEWQEDPEYTSWSDPIAILTGEDADPINSSISVNSLGQHVVNPNYLFDTKWITWDSQDSEPLSNGGKYIFENDDASCPPSDNIASSYKRAFNETTNTWWVRVDVVGKSWTSVKIPEPKSWTSYEVEISSSWTGVKEYTGKSWHSRLAPVSRFWSTGAVPVDVTFNNSNVIIDQPKGATLNDLSISAKLSTSTEYEALPKVLVDGEGWIAHSSLNLAISQNTPLILNEGQSVAWYTPDHSDISPDDDKTSGKIQGGYAWSTEADLQNDGDEYNSIYSVSVTGAAATDSVLHQSNLYLENVFITASNGLHLYDVSAKQSWTSRECYGFAEPEGLNTPIDADTAGIQVGWVEVDCSTQEEFDTYIKENNIVPTAKGLCYFHIKDDGNIIMWKSDGPMYAWEQDLNYSSDGIEIIGDPNNGTGIKLPAQQGLIAIVDNNVTYYSNYKTLYVVSDYGYDMPGGIKIDVSRLSLDGETTYANLYAYEIMSYAEPFVVDSDSLKMDLNDIDEKTAVDYDFDFNFPDGKYLLTLMNSATPIDKLTMQIVALYHNEEIGPSYYLHEFGDVSFIDFSKSRKYYIDFDTSKFDAYLSEKPITGFRIKLHLETSGDVKGYLRFDSAYKYTVPEALRHDENLFNAILNKVILLDKNKQYDYAYIVDEDVLIENPLKAESFLDPNHMYNQFTICQMDLPTSYVHITNVSK